jgi:hypothetical protein
MIDWKAIFVGVLIGAAAGFLMGHAGAKGGVQDVLKRTGMTR